MSMERVTLRLPPAVIRAYDRADGNRSAVMRRVLNAAVADGDVEGVPADLQTLAEVETAVDGGRLGRRRGTFRRRVAEFFRDKWRTGYVTDSDAEEMAESWRREATVYGPEYVAFVDAVVGWYTQNWDPAARPDWPDPSAFHATADPGAVDIDDRLRDVVEEGRDRGLSRGEVRARLSQFHPDGAVEVAVRDAFGDAAAADGGDT